MSQQSKVIGVVLAGGQARRMAGADKGLIVYQGAPLVSYAINALMPVVDQVIINANRHIDAYQQFALPVLSDGNDCFDGPLAGVLAVMLNCDSDVLVALPCDSPLVTAVHVRALVQARTRHQAEVAIAHDGQCLQPVFLAIKTDVHPRLHAYLATGGRKLSHFLTQLHYVTVDFSDTPELFININTLNQLAELEGGYA